MELTIFNNILFNELRPWQKENCQGNSFSTMVQYLGKADPTNSKDLFSRIKTLVKDYPPLLIFNENYLGLTENQLFRPLYEFQIPAHFNAATEYYAELLKLESARILNNVIAAVNETDNAIDKHFRANTAWKNLRYVAVMASAELTERGLTSIPEYKFTSTPTPDESAKRNTHFVLYLLKQYSTRLFFEIQILFKDHLQTIESPDHFYLHTLKQPVPVADPLTFTPHYYKNQAQQIISFQSYNEEATTQLLKEVINNLPISSNDTINIIGALENFIFVNQFNIKSKNGNFESLATPAKSNDLYKKINKPILSQIKNKVYGHQRLEIIQTKLEELSNLNIDSKTTIPANKLSAPRKLAKWLKQQESIYTTHLDTVFSPEPDPAEELRKTPKPLAKRTKAEINEQKAKATELLNFMSGVNIHNVKIMADKDFARLLRYTHELIEFDKVPPGIIQIPQINISNIMIRYTYYLIHRAIHGTTRIKDVYIDFLHDVFFQFMDVQKSTTKTKFSVKPNYYESDLEKMSE